MKASTGWYPNKAGNRTYVMAKDGEFAIARVFDGAGALDAEYNARLFAASYDMAEVLEEAERCLANMIFMAEAAERHGIAAGDVERARHCLSELKSVRSKVEG